MPIVSVDLRGSVPDNTVGGIADIPDDDYRFAVDSLDYKINDNDRPQWSLAAFVISDCPFRGVTLKETFVFKADEDDKVSERGRNRFHAFLLALGFPLDKLKFKMNTDEIKGETFMGRTYHDTMPASEDGKFAARPVSKIAAFSPDPEKAGSKKKAASAPAPAASKRRAEEEDEEDEPAPKARKTTRRAVDEDEDDEPAPPRKKRVIEEDEDDEPAPVTKAKRKAPPVEEEEDEPAPRKRRAPAEEEEEDEPAPKARKRRAAAEEDDEDLFPTKPAKRKAPVEEDEDDEPAPRARSKR